MPIECRKSTAGGKGNKGMFIERDPNVVAAGLPSAQQDESVGEHLKHFLLKDEVDALLSDAIIPPPEPRPLPPLRKPIPLDTRFAGPFGDVAALVNPPEKTKFETLVDDFKSTLYKSYWKTPLGHVPDPVPMFPEGFDVEGTTYGKPTEFHGRLYDLVMPKVPIPGQTPESKLAGVQKDYNYCAPPFDPNLTYGYRTFVDKRGRRGKCCVTDDRISIGLGNKAVMDTIQSDFIDHKQPRLGAVLAPFNNKDKVPEGYTFGKLSPPDNIHDCLTRCEINSNLEFFRKCLKHVNSLRRMLSTRFLRTFFNNFYLTLKYEDKDHTNWLPREVIYKYCGIKLIRFDPDLVEPILGLLQAFDENTHMIKYRTFITLINPKELFPFLPKVPDFPSECFDYRTTYTEMVKPDQPPNNSKTAGLPSGRYFDLDYPITPLWYCSADRICLPQESDVRSCINPSVFTALFVDHRDMYERQEPSNVRRVFEAAGDKFTDESFEAIWKEAQKLHSKGWVSYESFRRTLENQPNK